MPDPRCPPALPPRAFPPPSAAQPVLPLQGLTILAVEDSRFAAEALRLMCQRSGARLRRADSVATARAHLRVYRPDAVLVDMSLPDEPGCDLIGQLAFGTPNQPAFDGILLACSGDPANRNPAMEAGAAGFLEKPMDKLSDFQAAILCHLPGPAGVDRRPAQTGLIPDQQALQDDLSHAIGLLKQPGRISYAADFLHSLARSSHDPVLEAAIKAVRQDGLTHEHLTRMLTQRVRNAPSPFSNKTGHLPW